MSTLQKCQLVDFNDNVIEDVRRSGTSESSFNKLLDATKSETYDNILNSFIFKFFVGFMLIYALVTVMSKVEYVLIKREKAVNSAGAE